MNKLILTIFASALLVGFAGPADASPREKKPCCGCSAFVCGDGNGTQLTGIDLAGVTAQPISAVILPSGQTINLR